MQVSIRPPLTHVVPELPARMDDNYVALMRGGRYLVEEGFAEKKEKDARFVYEKSYYETRAEATTRGEDGRVWVFEVRKFQQQQQEKQQ